MPSAASPAKAATCLSTSLSSRKGPTLEEMSVSFRIPGHRNSVFRGLEQQMPRCFPAVLSAAVPLPTAPETPRGGGCSMGRTDPPTLSFWVLTSGLGQGGSHSR